nr:Hypothetical protein CBG16703 [Haemonchus contortus]
MNPSNTTTHCKENKISFLVQAAVRLLPHTQARQFITKLVKEEFAKALLSETMSWSDLAVGGMNLDKFNEEKQLLLCEHLVYESIFVRDVVGLAPGERAFIANGIVIGPFDEQELIIESDVELIARIVESRGAHVIASYIDKWKGGYGDGLSSDLVMRSFALVSKHAVSQKRTIIKLGENKRRYNIFCC